jgi:hypothetical protein
LRGLRRVVGLMLVVALVAAGFVSWDRWLRRAGPTNPGMKCPAVVPARHRLPLAASGVHRVALIGDSLMVQASCSIADSLRNVGIETSLHAYFWTGLLTGPVNWLAQTQAILRTEHPDVVLAIFVGNYLPPTFRDASGAVVKDNTPAFYREWQAHARLLSAEVRAAHARLYWVSPPPITYPPLSHADQLFDGYRTISGDHFLSSGRVLAGPNDSEVMSKRTCGRTRVIRASDRIHLTDDGARIYGQQIAHDLTADLGILPTPLPC